MSSSFRLMRRLPQGRWTKTTATTTTTTLETPEQDEQQQQAQKPRKRPCALPTGQLTDRTEPTSRPTDRRNRTRTKDKDTTTRTNNGAQQQPADNRPVNRETLSNSGYLVVQLSSTVREIRAGNSAGLVEVAPGGRSEIQQVSASGGRLGWAAGLITHYRLPNSNERTTPGTPTGALIAHAWR